MAIYKETTASNATQAVFLDIGTPGGSAKFCIYDWLKQYWISKGINEREVDFIQNYKTAEAKQTLFNLINKGKIRILIASSESGGIGVNIQERLIAIHHADFALRPDILEQREGRGIRQGNIHDRIQIYSYITEGSNGYHGADTVMLQFLQNKQKVRDRFFRCDPSLRTLSEGDNATELYMMLKAESTGDERIIRYTEIEVNFEEKLAELALTHSEIARIEGKKAGSLYNSNKLIDTYQKNLELVRQESDRVFAYPNYFHFCFDDGTLVVGREVTEEPKTIDLTIEENRSSLEDWAKILVEKYERDYLTPSFGCSVKAIALSNPDDARNYTAKKITLNVENAKAAVDKSRAKNEAESTSVFELGFFKGLTAFFSVIDEESTTLWLEGLQQHQLFYRKSPKLLIEQFDKAIAKILDTPDHYSKLLTSARQRREQLLKIHSSTGDRLKELDKEIEALSKEKNDLQHVLNIED